MLSRIVGLCGWSARDKRRADPSQRPEEMPPAHVLGNRSRVATLLSYSSSAS